VGVHVARIVLDGADNVRDLGGYRSSDGLAVVPGLLFRADGLNRLSDTDISRLAGLRTVIDLRTRDEVLDLGPDRLPSGAVLASFPVSGGDLSWVYDLVSSGDFAEQRRSLGDGRAAEFMAGTYRGFVADPRQRTAFAGALHVLGSFPPVLFHCTGGKDRTGWLAVVLLLALGVPFGPVMSDYMASNEYLRGSYERLRGELVKAGLLADPELLRPVMEVHPGYLEAALDEASRVYGSFESYLVRGLGLSEIPLRRLRNALLG
jgi:protein-tyrosine phosphatase